MSQDAVPSTKEILDAIAAIQLQLHDLQRERRDGEHRDADRSAGAAIHDDESIGSDHGDDDVASVPYGIPPLWAGGKRAGRFANESTGYDVPPEVFDADRSVAMSSLNASTLRNIHRRYPCPANSCIGVNPTLDPAVAGAAPSSAAKAVLRDFVSWQDASDWTLRALIPALHTLRRTARHLDADAACELWGELPDERPLEGWPDDPRNDVTAAVFAAARAVDDAIALNRHYLSRGFHSARARILELQGLGLLPPSQLEKLEPPRHDVLFGPGVESALRAVASASTLRPKVTSGGSGRRQQSGTGSAGNTTKQSNNFKPHHSNKWSNSSQSTPQRKPKSSADQPAASS